MASEDNPFSERPDTLSRLDSLSKGEQVIVVTRAYGPNGEDLMDEGDYRFSGERGIKLRVRQGELEDDVILSPFFGDPSKVHEAPFVQGERCVLLCPESGEELDEIPEMRTDEGGHYYAIYLTDKLQDGELVAVNDIWGNPRSRLMSEGEMLRMLAEIELSEAEEQ